MLYYFITAIILSVLGIVGQTFVILNYYDAAIHLYARETAVPYIFNWCLFGCVIILASSYIIMRKKTFPESFVRSSRFVVFTQSMTGFILIASAAYGIYRIAAKSVFAPGYAGIVSMLVPFCAVPAALFFLIPALLSKPDKKLVTVLGFFAVIWGALSLVSAYFDMTTPLNCPIRILHQMSIVTIMLYLLYELRFGLGIPKSKLYFTVSYIAILMIMTCSGSNILLTLLRYSPFEVSTLDFMTEFVLGLYIISRLFSFRKFDFNMVKEEEAQNEE